MKPLRSGAVAMHYRRVVDALTEETKMSVRAMRPFWILGLMLWAAGAQATPPVRTIDLGQPGALDAIEQTNPEHYRKIVSILSVSRGAPCETLPQVLKAKFGAEATTCHPYQVLTSYPARRHLAFRLGDTAYVTTVVLGGGTARALPAR